MKKILIVITNRSSWGRYQSVCEAIHKHKDLELQLVVAGGALHLDIPYPISDKLYCLVDGDSKESMVLTTTTLTTQLVGVFTRLKPDIVYIHGDRFEMLGVAMTASYMNIPIAHAEGGEITGCIDDKVRNAITELADIHFPVTSLAGIRLNKKNRRYVYPVGSPALDLLKDIPTIHREPYVVILVHPNTTVNEDVNELIEATREIKEKIIWINPNFDAGSKIMLKEIHKLNVEFVKDLSPMLFYATIKGAKMLIGNTSSGIKEGSFLGVNYLCVGDRQRNREHCVNTTFVEYKKEKIVEAYKQMIDKKFEPSDTFGDGNSSKKIADVLAVIKIE